ncbi:MULTISPECIES: response regulator transcription factor [unclassified Paenibacillus]|uniref:response regulator transcription factor n=1 Tax=unclassified Paenibacillus TaxID=185978 RepID=UPI002404FA7D|nr:MULTISPECIES: response regulator transcription factor [unclassified Paenibacillus]MDF9839505.1 two-component system competent response regulator ComA [Paenibacillus sp. PastF-2]MDF9846086.1 two-component system competent response regulator ComA [Paenibacillus sp. PastM-2]MDF9852659.1 two-component system competent response regulator ComA [Paenibacillus sp. PastF-1]MDH6477610.1 two-component system competent response regulator ComA [Paenibacillus sp. PastH-2]MDH6505353.1 two-component system
MNILLLDDHPAVTEGTKLILEQDPFFKVTVQNHGSGLIELLKCRKFEVMLFDLFMPPYNGIDLAAEVLNVYPESCILIYTGFDIMPHLNRLIDHGLSGYVPKTGTRDQLITAIRCAARKEVVLPLDMFRAMRRNLSASADGSEPGEKPSLLHRDIEMLRQVALGKGNREISEQMHMSQRSLEYHLTHLFQKLGVKSRIEAVSKAKDIGILENIIL